MKVSRRQTVHSSLQRRIDKPVSSSETRVSKDVSILMRNAEEAIHAVLTNRVIWDEEAARTGAAPLPWPLEIGEGLNGVLRWLFTGAVISVLDAQAATRTHTELQVVLRVVKRGVDRAAQILEPRWNRPKGWSYFLNWLKAERMDQAAQLGLKGHAAAEFAGLRVASSYRAQQPKRRR